MRRFLFALLLWCLLPATVAAQISVPYTFTANTVASPDEVNANFAKLVDACNRNACTMLGGLIWNTDNAQDIGQAGNKRPRRIYVGTEVLSPLFTGSFSGTLTGTLLGNVSGTSGAFTGTVTAGTFSGSGSALTNVPETGITDGNVLARVAGSETITGPWAFANLSSPLATGTTATGTQVNGPIWYAGNGSTAQQHRWRTDITGTTLRWLYAAAPFSTELVTVSFPATGGVLERGRSVALGEYQGWTPTVAAQTGSVTVGQGDLRTARYTLVGKMACFTLVLAEITLSGGPSTRLSFTLPVTPAQASGGGFGGFIAQSGSFWGAAGFLASGVAYVYHADGSTWANGTDNLDVHVSGCYEAQ